MELLNIYLKCFQSANRSMKEGWIIVPSAIVLYLVFIAIAGVVGKLGIVGGFILGLMVIGMLTLIYSWLKSAHEGGKLLIREMFKVDFALFSSILSVAFLLFIVDLAFSGFKHGPENNWVVPVVKLMVFVLLNPIPETIYIGNFESFAAVQKAFRVSTRASLEWFLPLIVLMLPVIFMEPEKLPLIFAASEPLLPVTPLLASASYFNFSQGMLGQIVVIALGVYFFFFRAALYERLESRC